MALPLHSALVSLAPLVGRWRGEGRGDYPTIDAFEYREEVAYTHVGKPFLAYTQRTWKLPDGAPLHSESGYLRATGEGAVELVLAHPSGVVEVSTGRVHDGDVEVASIQVLGTPTAKSVETVRRSLHVDGDVLRYRVDMAAVGQPLGFHLEAELHRA